MRLRLCGLRFRQRCRASAGPIVDLEGVEPSVARVDSPASEPLQAHKAQKPRDKDLVISVVGLHL